MWRHTFRSHTDAPIDALWRVLADIPRWPEIDTQIERIEVDGVPRLGTAFKLKPIGGPTLSLVVDRFEPPSTYADLCSMPLAKMRTTHSLKQEPGGTAIEVTIEIFGLLAPLWSRVVGRKHASGLEAQTRRFVQRAKEIAAAESAGPGSGGH